MAAMSASAAHADAFYAEVLRDGQVWAIRDADGFPAPETDRRAMPFWSSRSRAEKITEHVDAFRGWGPIHLVVTIIFWGDRGCQQPAPDAAP